jgi:hypothetical protein
MKLIPQSVREPLVFELRSFLGRALSRRIELDPARKNYLNLGSGEGAVLDGFVNVDVFPFPFPWRRPKSYFGADLRHPLRLGDAVVDGVFSEHTLEHLTYDEAAALLRESFRVMKRAARIRVIVPDLELFLRAYCGGDEGWFVEWERLMFVESGDAERARRRLLTPLQAISFVTQEYGHRSAWDFATMTRVLEAAGFSDVQRRAFREGGDANLLRELDAGDRRHVSLYVEAVKA